MRRLRRGFGRTEERKVESVVVRTMEKPIGLFYCFKLGEWSCTHVSSKNIQFCGKPFDVRKPCPSRLIWISHSCSSFILPESILWLHKEKRRYRD
ncbi:hypothetical protein ACET3Z_013127 [Daucus carota]